MRVTLTISTRRKLVHRKAKVTTFRYRFSALPAVLPTPLGKTTADGTLIEHFGRRCQGWFEDDDGHREQCDFRFRFKIARNVTQKMILPPAVAASVTPFWLAG